MLQYLIQVLIAMLPALIVLGCISGFFARGAFAFRRKTLVWSFLAALLVSVCAAVARANTNAFIREYYNLVCLAAAFAAEIYLISKIGRDERKSADFAASKGCTAACILAVFGSFAYTLPDLFLYPREFAIELDTVFHEIVLYKSIGYALALLLALLTGLCVNRVVRAAPYGRSEKTFLYILVFSACFQFILLFQILMLRTPLMGSEVLVNILIVLIEYRNAALFAVFSAIALSAVTGMAANWNPAFAGPNPAVIRKQRAEARRQNRWSGFAVLFLIAAVLIMTVGVWADSRTVELAPPQPVTPVNGKIEIPVETVNDGHLHRYGYTTEEGTAMRFIIIQKSAKAYGVGLDACDICGATGYYERGNGQIVCILCDVVMNIGTIGMPGGCNPVPLAYEIAGGKIIVRTEDLDAQAYRFE